MAIILSLVAWLSWYDPGQCAAKPINCFDAANPYRMAAGHDARLYYGHALACPAEFPIGTLFVIEGSRYGLADGAYTCLDRGGAVTVLPDGTVVLDLLRKSPIWSESLIVTAYVPQAVWPARGGEVYLELARIPPLSMHLLGPASIRRGPEKVAL